MLPSLNHILLVEDDPGHARLVVRNLQRAGVANPIVWVDNGQLALDRLLRQGVFAQNPQPLPKLVLLDLNLPGLDGFQILSRIRADARTRELVVALLTTTDLAEEIRHGFELGCNRFLRKPIAYEQFSETVHQIRQLLDTTAATA